MHGDAFGLPVTPSDQGPLCGGPLDTRAPRAGRPRDPLMEQMTWLGGW